MSENMIIHEGDDLKVVLREREDGMNDGSIIKLTDGYAICIAKAPHYISDSHWQHNADLICKAIKEMRGYCAGRGMT